VRIAETVDEALQYVKSETDTVMLGFSGGKDSVAAWLVLREHFKRVVPIFHYWIPDLEFVNQGLHYFEKFFSEKIVRLPHPCFAQMIQAGAYQPPDRYPVCEWWNIEKATFREQADWVAEDMKLPSRWMAVGIRAADSVIRRKVFQARGFVDLNQQKFFPIGNLKKDDLIHLFRTSGVKLSPEYSVMGRSFDGLNSLYLEPVRKYFPQDFRKILDWFPLAEAELIRREIYYGKQTEEAKRF
jgi:predicted phosphoadenosine phosphosulfate sulfurtransferase